MLQSIQRKRRQVLSRLKRTSLVQVTYRRAREMHAYARLLIKTSDAPAVKFVIFAQGRTGSELLRSLINSSPEIHCEDEILYHKVFNPQAYIRGRLALSKAKAYGFKVKIYQLSKDQGMREPGQFVHNLHEQGWKIIYLKRRNILRQTFSAFFARHRKVFHHKHADDSQAVRKMRVDPDKLVTKMREREAYLAQEKQILENLPHVTVVYEDELLNAENHQSASDKVFDFLGVPCVPVETQFIRITSSRLADFIENYDQVVQAVSEAGYAEFLTM